MSSIFKLLKEGTSNTLFDNVITFLNSENNLTHRSVPFYMHSLKKVYEENILYNNAEISISRKREILENGVKALRKLLSDLDEFMTVYTNSLPHQFRPPFNYSFYELKNGETSYSSIGKMDIDNYDYEQFKDRFFFASLGCSPVNLEYLNHL
ncbi:MAG: hypothetical protein LIO97_06715, partial [Tannerellaceae bacterium]|nr:hypothetical protein [Tannerellaceae bacterium]